MSEKKHNCDECLFDVRQFVSTAEKVNSANAEITEIRQEIYALKSDIEKFKALRNVIDGALKTLWIIAGLITMVSYDWFKSRYLK